MLRSLGPEGQGLGVCIRHDSQVASSINSERLDHWHSSPSKQPTKWSSTWNRGPFLSWFFKMPEFLSHSPPYLLFSLQRNFQLSTGRVFMYTLVDD